MIVHKDRENLALTVFVPYDCDNACPFCTSKQEYQQKTPDYEAVINTLKPIFKSFTAVCTIKDVVFTGGEPLADLEKLREMVHLVPDVFDVYINTTLPAKNFKEFREWAVHTPKIKGINVSRHTESYEKDCETLCDIVTDDVFRDMGIPTRINCVVDRATDRAFVEAVTDRWQGKNVELSFRLDYRLSQTDLSLHNPYDPIPIWLSEMGFKYLSHTQCNVCDTTIFGRNGLKTRYHKGKMFTSRFLGKLLGMDTMAVNDLIVDHTGKFKYDWYDGDEKITESVWKWIARTAEPERYTINSGEGLCGVSSHSCGGRSLTSACGGRTCSYGCGGGC